MQASRAHRSPRSIAHADDLLFVDIGDGVASGDWRVALVRGVRIASSVSWNN